jgi:hypothetical protein
MRFSKLANFDEVTHWINPASCSFLFSAWKPVLAQDGQPASPWCGASN